MALNSDGLVPLSGLEARLLPPSQDYFVAQLLSDKPVALKAPDLFTVQRAYSVNALTQLELKNSRYSMKLRGEKLSELDVEIDPQSYPLRILPYEDWFNYEGFKAFLDNSAFFAKRYAHFHKHTVKADVRSQPFEPLWLASDKSLELYNAYYSTVQKRLRGRRSPISPHQAYVRVSPVTYIVFSGVCLAMYYADAESYRVDLHRIIMSEDWWHLNERRKLAALRLMNA